MLTRYDSVLQDSRLPRWLSVAAGIILVLTAWLWWTKVSVDPQRVFNGMLEQSLTTTSVTLHLEQSGQGVRTRQAIQFQLGAQNFARATTNIMQSGNTVSTETIGTQDYDYTRYTKIDTTSKTSSGKPVDTSHILHTWAKATPEDAAKNHIVPLLPQAVLGVGLPLGSLAVPMGNVDPDQRHALLEQIRDDRVYDVNFGKVEKRRVNGRTAYAYPVTLQPITYVRMMQNFAADLGLTQLEKIDPNFFSGAEPLHLTFVIDAHARQLIEVDYPPTNYKERYSGYGVRGNLQLPHHTISSDELQKRLSALQN